MSRNVGETQATLVMAPVSSNDRDWISGREWVRIYVAPKERAGKAADGPKGTKCIVYTKGYLCRFILFMRRTESSGGEGKVVQVLDSIHETCASLVAPSTALMSSSPPSPTHTSFDAQRNAIFVQNWWAPSSPQDCVRLHKWYDHCVLTVLIHLERCFVG